MSKDTHIVDEVTQTVSGNRACWLVGVRAPDGTRMAHVFHPDVLMARAAEYDIDPADSATLLDIVLHERFMTEAEHNHRAPDFVFNTDADTARAAHLARVEAVKDRAVVTDPNRLLGPIHAHHRTGLNRETHERRRAQVTALRAARANETKERGRG
jgi:hypothetical protein